MSVNAHPRRVLVGVLVLLVMVAGYAAKPTAAAGTPAITAVGAGLTEVVMDSVLGAGGQVDVHAWQSPPVVVDGDADCPTTAWGTPAPNGGRLSPPDANAGRDALRDSAAGTSGGRGCVDIARSDLGPRSIAADGDRSTFEYYAFALDDVTWASPSLQAPPAMSVDQIRGVFSCAITDWSQLPGGGAGPIQRVFPAFDSGTGATFIASVLGGVAPVASGPNCPPIVWAEENRGEVGDQPALAGVYQQAIMPFSAGSWVYQANNSSNPTLDDRGGVRIGAIVPSGGASASFPVTVTASATFRLDPNLVNERNPNLLDPTDTSSLPGVRYLYNVIDSASPAYSAARDLVGFDARSSATPTAPLCSGAKRSMVLSAGFVPLPPATVGSASHSTCRVSGIGESPDPPGVDAPHPEVPADPTTPTTTPPSTAPPATSPSGSHRVLLGVYKWSQPAAVDAYSNWIGRAVDLAMDFMPSSSQSCETDWSVIDGNATILDQWSQWVKAAPGRDVVFGVPMLSPIQPGNASIGCWNVDANAIATELRGGCVGRLQRALPCAGAEPRQPGAREQRSCVSAGRPVATGTATSSVPTSRRGRACSVRS